jgi:hypothetical protein
MTVKLNLWYTKKDIFDQIEELKLIQGIDSNNNKNILNSDQIYDSLIDSVNEDLKKKCIEIDNKINLNEEKYIYRRIKNLRRKCIAFRLNPYIINNLRIITGDSNYTLYSLDRFSYLLFDKSCLTAQQQQQQKNVDYKFTLLEINDRFDQPTKKEYFIMQRKIINYDLGLTEIYSDIIYY